MGGHPGDRPQLRKLYPGQPRPSEAFQKRRLDPPLLGLASEPRAEAWLSAVEGGGRGGPSQNTQAKPQASVLGGNPGGRYAPAGPLRTDTFGGNQVKRRPESQLAVPPGPVVVDPVRLLLHPRFELEALGRRSGPCAEQVLGAALVVGGEVLVEDEDRLDPGVLEEGVPGGLLDQQLLEQVVDRLVVEAELGAVLLDEGAVGRGAVGLDRAGAGAGLVLAPGRGLHRLPERDRLAHLVGADDADEGELGEDGREELGQRHVAVGGDVAQRG